MRERQDAKAAKIGQRVQGVVLADHIRSVDFRERSMSFHELRRARLARRDGRRRFAGPRIGRSAAGWLSKNLCDDESIEARLLLTRPGRGTGADDITASPGCVLTQLRLPPTVPRGADSGSSPRPGRQRRSWSCTRSTRSGSTRRATGDRPACRWSRRSPPPARWGRWH